jgi:hypothetical protein
MPKLRFRRTLKERLASLDKMQEAGLADCEKHKGHKTYTADKFAVELQHRTLSAFETWLQDHEGQEIGDITYGSMMAGMALISAALRLQSDDAVERSDVYFRFVSTMTQALILDGSLAVASAKPGETRH